MKKRILSKLITHKPSRRVRSIAKNLIKSFVGLVWVEIKQGTLLRKECIESINENNLSVRTVSGMDYRFETKREFLAFLKKIGINE